MIKTFLVHGQRIPAVLWLMKTLISVSTGNYETKTSSKLVDENAKCGAV